MGEYVEFVTVHYPHLLDYVILIAHEDEYTGAESIGSGVMIASGGHHFIATAAHCIMRNSRVMRYQNFYITTNDIPLAARNETFP